MDEIERNEELYPACSFTDCTGLMPRPPISEAELESYQDLYQMETTVPVPKETPKQRKKRKN